MADRAAAVAEAEKKSLGSLRLQEKYNVVRGFEGIGAKQEEFVKDWPRRDPDATTTRPRTERQLRPLQNRTWWHCELAGVGFPALVGVPGAP